MRFGIIGTGNISLTFCDALRQHGDTVTAIYSRKEESGRLFAQKSGFPHALIFCDLSLFCAQAPMDAVYIASPNYIHAEQAKAVLQSGKSVLLEKPATPHYAQWCDLWQTVQTEHEKSGVILMEAMRPHYDPAYAELRAILPKIGPIRRATFEFCQYSSRYDAFLQGEIQNAFCPALGNAALLDIGIYPLHVCCMLFGAPRGWDAGGFTLSNGMEGGGTIRLDYDSFCADIIYSKVCQSVTPSVLLGEKGAITIDKISRPQQIQLYAGKEAPQNIPFPYAENNMIYELEAFCRSHRAHTLPDQSTVALTLSLCDQILSRRNIHIAR